jgi:hypothetical protein
MFIPDKDQIKGLNNLIDDSVGYWDDVQGQNLKYARNQSERMVIGKQIDTSKLYRYQIPFVDNEIHIAVDTIISYVTAQTPRPEAYPSEDTDKGRVLSSAVEKALMAYCEKYDVSQEFEKALYGLLVKRVGILKLYYCNECDEIHTKAIDPNWVIVDKNAKMGENPGFICELHKCTLLDLVLMFPEKKTKIFELMKIKQGTQNQMTTEVVWREVWATVYDRGKKQEVCFSYIKDLMLGKYKSPNWLYSGNDGSTKNYLPEQFKPYVPLNYLNDGSHWIDQTTPIEQAYSMQDVLNKRGRQIMENADTANGFLAVSSEAVDMDDAENLIGDPNQKIVLKTSGRPIDEFIMQVEPHMLPSFVVEDKQDLRTTLHNLMGTPSQLSGTNQEGDDTDTLGQAIMIKNQASGRQDRLARAVTLMAKRYFNMLVQMMQVHYTDKHKFVYNGGDGDFQYVTITRYLIDSGMEVGVRAGSTLPFDKSRQEAVAMNLAKMGMISPLDLYKDLHMDNPQARYDNWFKWKTQPELLAQDAENQEQDGQAYMEFVEIMNGKKDVRPYEEATPEHVLTHRKQMITDQFLKAGASKQKAMLDLIGAELRSLELRTELEQLSAPPMGAQAAPQPPGMGAPMGAPGQPPGSPPTGPMPGAPMGPPQGNPMGGGGAPIPFAHNMSSIMGSSGPGSPMPQPSNPANPMQMPPI